MMQQVQKLAGKRGQMYRQIQIAQTLSCTFLPARQNHISFTSFGNGVKIHIIPPILFTEYTYYFSLGIVLSVLLISKKGNITV